MAEIPATPELDKMREVQAESQAIGEFLDFLSNNGIFLAKHMPREGWSYDPLVALPTSNEEILAHHFEIDLKKVEQERRALLNALREAVND